MRSGKPVCQYAKGKGCFTNAVKNDTSEFVVLKPVVINNENPHRPGLRKGFQNDYHQAMKAGCQTKNCKN